MTHRTQPCSSYMSGDAQAQNLCSFNSRTDASMTSPRVMPRSDVSTSAGRGGQYPVNNGSASIGRQQLVQMFIAFAGGWQMSMLRLLDPKDSGRVCRTKCLGKLSMMSQLIGIPLDIGVQGCTLTVKGQYCRTGSHGTPVAGSKPICLSNGGDANMVSRNARQVLIASNNLRAGSFIKINSRSSKVPKTCFAKSAIDCVRCILLVGPGLILTSCSGRLPVYRRYEIRQ
jgi:hypothetical protein